MISSGLWITLTAGLIASSCALLGSFLVLRREALLTDAVSHAVLPGIVLAWLVTGSRAPLPVIIGAAAFGALCVILVEALVATRLIKSDGAIGLTFPVLFSLGVLGIDRWASDIHLDLDATIYGEIAFIPFSTTPLFGFEIPHATITAALLLLLNLVLVITGWRLLKAASFDAVFATSVGVNVRGVGRLLLLATAITAVVAFESVGAILVVTLFIVPAAAAFLLTKRLLHLVFIAVGFGWLTAILGWNSAVVLNASVAGMMGVAAGAIFFIALVGRLIFTRQSQSN